MQIALEIPAGRIANMMVSAIESGDPVTNGWCDGIYYKNKKAPPPAGRGLWYAQPSFYESASFQIEIVELVNDGPRKRSHIIRRPQLLKGLAVMATKFPRQFAHILKDDTDAPCADAFLQSLCFGKEKYA